MMKIPAITFSTVSCAAKATANPINPKPTTKPVTFIPNSFAAVRITTAHNTTFAIRKRKFSSPTSNSVLSSNLRKYLLTIPIKGIPSIKIRIPEAGPADIES